MILSTNTSLVYRDINDWNLCEIPLEPLPEHGWIRVKVYGCGICGSDIQKLLYLKPPPGYLRTSILGHELTGRVVELSAEGADLCVGDRVAVEPLISCGSCEFCRSGNQNLCPDILCIGRDLPGGFAQYVSVPSRCAYRLPTSLSLIAATLLDPTAVAVHCILRGMPEKMNWRGAVVGDGTLGLITAQLMRSFGAADVTLLGKRDCRLEVARHFGVATKQVGKDDIRECGTFDFVVEAVGGGQGDSLELCSRLACRGGSIGVLGVYPHGFGTIIEPRSLFSQEIQLFGSNSYSQWQGKNEFEIALEFLRSGAILAHKLITHKLPLEAFATAMELSRGRQAIKIVVTPNMDSEVEPPVY